MENFEPKPQVPEKEQRDEERFNQELGAHAWGSASLTDALIQGEIGLPKDSQPSTHAEPPKEFRRSGTPYDNDNDY